MKLIQSTGALVVLVSLLTMGSCKKDGIAEINTFSFKVDGVLRQVSGDDKVIALAIRADKQITGILIHATLSESEYIILRLNKVATGTDTYIGYSNLKTAESYDATPVHSPIDLKATIIEGTFSAQVPRGFDPDIIISEGKFRVKPPTQ